MAPQEGGGKQRAYPGDTCSSGPGDLSSRSSSVSSGSGLQSLFRYEAKRAGGVYEQMLRVRRAGNNSNTLSSIRDVQVHKSQSGQNTRVETELQPTGATADLNINIIMDSDSNLSNAIGHPSIEYESLDQTGASDDGPTSNTMGATEFTGGGSGGSSDVGLAHLKGTDSSVPSGQYEPNTGFRGSGGDRDGPGFGGGRDNVGRGGGRDDFERGGGRDDPDRGVGRDGAGRGRRDSFDRGGSRDGPDRGGSRDGTGRGGGSDGSDHGGGSDGSDRSGGRDGFDRGGGRGGTDRVGGKDGSGRRGGRDGSDRGGARDDFDRGGGRDGGSRGGGQDGPDRGGGRDDLDRGGGRDRADRGGGRDGADRGGGRDSPDRVGADRGGGSYDGMGGGSYDGGGGGFASSAGGSSYRSSEDDPQPSSSLPSSQDGGGGYRGGPVGQSTQDGESGLGLDQFIGTMPEDRGADLSGGSEESTPASPKSPQAGSGPSRAQGGETKKSDSDSEEEDEDEEGGEGEEGDMDDAQRHFQRYLDGEKVDLLRGPGKDGDEAKETKRKLPVGHLEKEGVVIGCMSVFADIHVKEYIVFLSDEMIQAFLVDPGRFRSVANRTKCEIEVTRRILNRRMGRYRWLKYLIVVIRGPSYSAIDQCDKMMIMLFPPFKSRKAYGVPAMVSMFLKETTPDNTDLYFNFQRTGPSQHMFGEIPLRPPFRRNKTRPLETTPWKAVVRRQQWGVLEPKNDRMETVQAHVYPERGGTLTGSLDHSIKWAEAAEMAVTMSKAKDVARALMLKARKMDSEPLYARAVAD